MACPSLSNPLGPSNCMDPTDSEWSNLEFTLSSELLKLKPYESSFFSTFSIIQALGLLVLNNKTPNKLPFPKVDWETILNKSETELSSIENITLKIANVIYADHTLVLNNNIPELVKDLKSSRIENLDFLKNSDKSRHHINNFVEKETNGLIKNLLQNGAVDEDTRSILLNCIYFYGSWRTPFDKDATHDYAWMSERTKKFKMMYQKNGHAKILRNQENNNLEMLRLPYSAGSNIGFYVILDRAAKTEQDAYKSLVLSDVVAKNFHNFKASLGSYGKIKIYLPKFEAESTFNDIKETIGKLGFPLANNDLALEPLIVSKIIHKAVCKVDEKGTEAAAATAIRMTRCLVIEDEPPFIVDRPFLYMIYDDKHNKMLFSGYFHQPTFV